MPNHDQVDPMRWVWRGVAIFAVLLGWFFIFWQNSFHSTAPVIVVCLSYLALVGVIYNLWRTGASAATATDEDAVDDSTWSKPLGALGELEREKRTLLKAIKEAEFDFEMGKLSKVDADAMIAVYRARAIEVIKELERLQGGEGTIREQIEREVRARLEVEVKPAKAAKKAAKKAAAEAKKPEPAAPVEAATPETDSAPTSKPDNQPEEATP
jgi:hypothetical protein